MAEPPPDPLPELPPEPESLVGEVPFVVVPLELLSLVPVVVRFPDGAMVVEFPDGPVGTAVVVLSPPVGTEMVVG